MGFPMEELHFLENETSTWSSFCCTTLKFVACNLKPAAKTINIVEPTQYLNDNVSVPFYVILVIDDRISWFVPDNVPVPE